MTSSTKITIYVHHAPGETRAVATDLAGRPAHLFSQRWSGRDDRARFGDIMNARLRTFADDVQGAFVELASGEEAFLRLKARDGLTEGALLRVEVKSEMRHEKLARVTQVEGAITEGAAFERWCDALPYETKAVTEDGAEMVDAAFDDALSPAVTLTNGGRLFIEQTRALIAFDIDTAGRKGRGSAGARALALNRDAAREMARQVSLRGLGGNLVLDCVGPLTAAARNEIQLTTVSALKAVGVEAPKVLKPSPIDLLEASIPWRVRPLEDQINSDSGEAKLLELLRMAQREAAANPMQFYELCLGGAVWQAYQARRSDADATIQTHFVGRVAVSESPSSENRITKR